MSSKELEDRACGEWGTGWWLLCKRRRHSQRILGMQIHWRDHAWNWAYLSGTPGISATDFLSPTVSCFAISWMWSQSESQKWKCLSLSVSCLPNRVGTSEVLCVIQKLPETWGVPPRVVCPFSGRMNCLITVPFKPRGDIGRKCTGWYRQEVYRELGEELTSSWVIESELTPQKNRDTSLKADIRNATAHVPGKRH